MRKPQLYKFLQKLLISQFVTLMLLNASKKLKHVYDGMYHWEYDIQMQAHYNFKTTYVDV